ncbi:unnamed protein product [Oikopleura dioica]|uniref:Uncharacterized protein n=1 Tax=Oikopleura dioica TaxID=34765 RepID=E4Y9I6_OIKDI|nr:unnamed protein product [Oikopleura dioica]
MKDCIVSTIAAILVCVFLGISFEDRVLQEFHKSFRPALLQNKILNAQKSPEIFENEASVQEIQTNLTAEESNEDFVEIPEPKEEINLLAKKTSTWDRKRRSILIVSSWKSGSSLLVEMFNRNPNFFFYCEPLVALGADAKDSQKLNMLKDIFQCKIPLAKNYVPPSRNLDGNSCLERGMCNDFRSFKFCQPPFCEAGGAKSAASCQESCKISWEQEETIELAKNACNKSHGVVASVTLLQDLLEIKKFINYKDVNLKAIFLIRDPRSVFRSKKLSIIRNEGKSAWTPARSKHEIFVLKGECAMMVENYNMALRNKGDIAKSIIFVRYEDLSLNYERFAADIFQAFKLGDFNEGISNLDKIRDFIQPWRRTSDKALENLSVDHVFYSWRMVDKASSGSQYVTEQEVFEVQEKCSEFMELFGYLRLVKESHKSFFNMRLDLHSYETILRNFTFDPIVNSKT